MIGCIRIVLFNLFTTLVKDYSYKEAFDQVFNRFEEYLAPHTLQRLESLEKQNAVRSKEDTAVSNYRIGMGSPSAKEVHPRPPVARRTRWNRTSAGSARLNWPASRPLYRCRLAAWQPSLLKSENAMSSTNWTSGVQFAPVCQPEGFR